MDISQTEFISRASAEKLYEPISDRATEWYAEDIKSSIRYYFDYCTLKTKRVPSSCRYTQTYIITSDEGIILNKKLKLCLIIHNIESELHVEIMEPKTCLESLELIKGLKAYLKSEYHCIG